jgi:hypothetical protein
MPQGFYLVQVLRQLLLYGAPEIGYLVSEGASGGATTYISARAFLEKDDLP